MPKLARRLVIVVALTTATTIGVVGVTSAATSLNISARKSALKFDKKTLRAKAGKVTIRMANPSSTKHAIGVEGRGIDKHGKTVGKGGTSRVTVTLKKGTYSFYCPVGGHEDAGMKGRLIVS
jgi:plastocyanin